MLTVGSIFRSDCFFYHVKQFYFFYHVSCMSWVLLFKPVLVLDVNMMLCMHLCRGA